MNILKLTIGIIFHPIDAFNIVKTYRDKIKVISSLILIVVSIVARILYIFTVHFPLSTIEVREANLWFEVAKQTVPIILFTVAAFAVTSIFDGESKINEIFFASSLGMTPYIIITLPLIGLSQVLGQQEAWIYNLILILMWAWIIILFFLNIKVLNNYDTGRAFLVSFLIIFTMLLLSAVIILIYLLTNQSFKFFEGIFTELFFKLKD